MPALRDGGADDQARLDADRSARRAAGMLDPLEQQLGGDAGALGRAEVDRRQRRPGELRERRCCPCPRRRRRRGTSMSAVAQRARARRAASRSLAQKIASGRAAREQALDGAAAGLDHEVVGHLDERLVALEPARARARRGSRACRAESRARCAAGPLTKPIRRRPTSCRWRTASAAPRRDFVRTVSTRRALRRLADHDHRHRRPLELARRALSVNSQRDEDQPVDEPLLEIARSIASSSSTSPPVECRSSRTAVSRATCLDRADHRRVDRVRDVGHRERDLARAARAERAGRRVRDVADRLGRLASRACRISGVVRIPFSARDAEATETFARRATVVIVGAASVLVSELRRKWLISENVF